MSLLPVIHKPLTVDSFICTFLNKDASPSGVDPGPNYDQFAGAERSERPNKI